MVNSIYVGDCFYNPKEQFAFSVEGISSFGPEAHYQWVNYYRYDKHNCFKTLYPISYNEILRYINKEQLIKIDESHPFYVLYIQ